MKKREVEELLFEERKNLGTKVAKLPLDASDVKHFLIESGRNHKNYFHYTGISRLRRIVSSKSLFLTYGADMNDQVEFMQGDPEKWKRTYLACFSFGALENIGMWSMYGHGPRESVRLCFPGKAMRTALAKWQMEHSFTIPDIPENKVSDVDHANIRDYVEGIELQDVLYSYAKAKETDDGVKRGSVLWNHRIANDTRCDEFRAAFDSHELSTFVKDARWAYESEVRLVVSFSKEIKGLRKVALDISSLLPEMSILLGPTYSKRLAVESLDGIEQDKVSESDYPIDFGL